VVENRVPSSRGLILLIDDDHTPTKYYVRRLEKDGYDVRHALNVDNALEEFRSLGESISLIILDIMMPPGEAFREAETDHGLKTGFLLFEVIRKHLPTVPVIILTNQLDEAVRTKIRIDDFTRILRKINCTPGDLLAEAAEMLEHS
jgi:DNA-binding response OmpR family regulator